MTQRLLLILPHPPHPPTYGAAQRSNLLYRALSRVAPVDTFLMAAEKIDDAERALLRERFNMIQYVHPLPRGARGAWRWLRAIGGTRVDQIAFHLGSRRVGHSPDPTVLSLLRPHVERGQYAAIVCRYLLTACKAGAFTFRPGTKLLLDVDDVETDVFASRLTSPGVPWWRKQLARHHVRRLDPIVQQKLRECDFLWFASASDQARFSGVDSAVLPNVPFSPVPGRSDPTGATTRNPPAPVPADSQVLFTIATMSHPPNAAGVDLFVHQAWPLVRRAHPRAVYRIAGMGMTPAQKARWGAVEGVDPIGFVEDVAGVYRDCAFCVVPVFEGGGTKIKVLEGFHYGRTCVTTAHAHAPYSSMLKDGDALCVAHDPAGMAEACIGLLADPPLRDRLATAGHTVVEEKFSIDRFNQVVRDALERVLGQ